MTGFLVFPALDLSSDEGGDEDHPIPDQSLDGIDDDEPEEEPEEDYACRLLAA